MQFTSPYLTPTYIRGARPHPPDGSENAGPRRYRPGNGDDAEVENYDVINDVGSSIRHQRSFTGVGAERNHAFVQNEATPCGGSSGGQTVEQKSGGQPSTQDLSDSSGNTNNIETPASNKDSYISATAT